MQSLGNGRGCPIDLIRQVCTPPGRFKNVGTGSSYVPVRDPANHRDSASAVATPCLNQFKTGQEAPAIQPLNLVR